MSGKNKFIKFLWENLRSLAFGSIGASYVQAGTNFTNPIVQLVLYNGTNQDVFISNDGINDKHYLPSGVSYVIDICANKVSSEGLYPPEYSGIFVKQGPGGAPTSGSVYVTAQYAG